MTNSKDDTPKYTIQFAPGAFDAFEGTQEELDELIAEITKMAEDGTLLEQSMVIDLDNLEPEDQEMLEAIEKMMDGLGEGDYEDLNSKVTEERKKKMN